MEFGDIVIDADEKAKRAEALKESEDAIKKHNAQFRKGESQFFMKLNPLSDLPADEEEEQKFGNIKRQKVAVLVLSNSLIWCRIDS